MTEENQNKRAQASVNDINTMDDRYEENPKKKGLWKKTVLSFSLCFVFSFLFMWGWLAHSFVSQQMKIQINKIISSLNEGGWDIAYSNLETSSGFMGKLASFDDIVLYSLNKDQNLSLKIPHLEISNSLFDSGKIRFVLPEEIFVSTKEKSYTLQLSQSVMRLDYSPKKGVSLFELQINDLNIPEVAQISSFYFGTEPNNPLKISALQILGIKMAKNIKMPWSDKIERLEIETHIEGEFPELESYRSSLYEWLEKGGFIAVERINLNWKDMALVGKGEINFNEKLVPNLKIKTASKGLLEFMDKMEEMNWFDGKGVFVSKILLQNKAFKLHEEDALKTVTTPIDYRDDKLLIENISVVKFKDDKLKK